MKASEVKVGGLYLAKVSGQVTTVRLDAVREHPYGTRYHVTNLRTGRTTTFRSAAKFRGPADPRKSVAPGSPISLGEAAVMPQNLLERKVTEPEEAPVPFAGTGTPTTPPTAPAGMPEVPPGPFAEAPEAAPTATISPASSPDGAAALGAGLASRIAAARPATGRKRGDPVAGMTPNPEQEEILAAAEALDRSSASGRVLVMPAGAGTGKTASLKMLEQIFRGLGQYTAFNKSLVKEAAGKFKRATCNTTNSLAFRAIGRHYAHRLESERVRSREFARLLGIEGQTVTLEGVTNDDGSPKQKRLSPEFLAGQVMQAIKKFCGSADPEVGEHHFHYIDGIDAARDGKRGWDNNNLVRRYLLGFAQEAWEDMSRVDGTLPFTHDCYVKIWQLGTGDRQPVIAADYILLDEAQDTAPVFLDILRRQEHALLVMVGDSNQQIYEWRGAVDAMVAFPGAPRHGLCQSYRFGQTIADVANSVLATLETPTDLVMRGNPAIPSRVATVAAPRAYLYRTNAGAVGRLMAAIAEGKRPHLIGGGAETVAWCNAAIELQNKRPTYHPDLACFESWQEVQEYSKTDEGEDLRLMVKLIDAFGAEEIRDALRDMPDEADADLVISTAHKSKGREWETVKLGPDFPTANRMSDPDRRLLYVALTRAKEVLDVTECPPFCGGWDKAQGEGGMEERFVPGLEVTLTVPMPSEADLDAYRASRAAIAPPAVPSAAPPRPAAAAPTVNPPPAPAADGPRVTYARLREGDWGLRAEGTVREGQMVTAVRRDGTRNQERVGKVVWSGNGITLAKIAPKA